MKYNVTINDKKFEVEVEKVAEPKDLGKRSGKSVMEASVNGAKTHRDSSSPSSSFSDSKATSTEEMVQAPMPGTVLSVKVTEEQMVKKGQVLVILEAMKMENEIKAPRDAVVAKIMVSNNKQVMVGDILISLK